MNVDDIENQFRFNEMWVSMMLDSIDTDNRKLRLNNYFEHPRKSSLSNWNLYCLVMFYAHIFMSGNLSEDESVGLAKFLNRHDAQFVDFINDYIEFAESSLDIKNMKPFHLKSGYWFMFNYTRSKPSNDLIHAGVIISSLLWDMYLEKHV